MGAAEQAATEKTYRAIGRFVFEFSQVEYVIRHYLADEIRLNEKYFSAIAESFDVGMLAVAAKQVFKTSRAGKEGDKIERLINQFLKSNETRKRIAHGLWVPFMDGGTVHYTSRNKLSPGSFADQAAELEKGADELCQLRADLERAFTAIFP